MAKSFERKSRRNDEEVFIPRRTRDIRRNSRRGVEKVALRAEIRAALVDA